MKRGFIIYIVSLFIISGLTVQAEVDLSAVPSIIFVKQTPVDFTVGTISDIFNNVEGHQPNRAQPVGGGLYRLDPDGTLTHLTADFENIAVRDPHISFDGTHVLFAMKQGGLGVWEIYEMTVDGTDLRQITSGVGVNNWDPAYLPDGRIVYLSDRHEQVARFNENLPTDLLPEGRLFIMNNDGSDSFLINTNPHGSFNPFLSQSGQIVFTQWDLNDTSAIVSADEAQANSYSRFLIWESMTDGSREGHPIFGAHLVDDFQGGFVEASELLDGSGDMVATLTVPQYTFGAGAIVRFTPRGPQDAQSFEYLTPAEHYTNGVDNTIGRYRSPIALPDGQIVASYAEGAVYDEYGTPDFDLVMLDGEGSHVVLHQDPDFWDWQAVPVISRPEPIIDEPLQLDNEAHYAIINTMDVELRNRNIETVFNGDAQPMIETGEAAFVRLFILTRPAAPYSGGDPNAQGSNTELLGTVPVAEDGSFAAIVPSRAMIIFDVTDAEGNVLVEERVWQELADGEVRTCGGCHTPDAGGGRTTNIALENPVNLTRFDVDIDDDGIVDLLEAYYEAAGQ